MLRRKRQKCRAEKRIGARRKNGHVRNKATQYHRLFFAFEMLLLCLSLYETCAQLARKVLQVRDAGTPLLQVREYDRECRQFFDALVINIPREVLPERPLFRPRKSCIYDGADEHEACDRLVERPDDT